MKERVKQGGGESDECVMFFCACGEREGERDGKKWCFISCQLGHIIKLL
jgi:hypothetical protein